MQVYLYNSIPANIQHPPLKYPNKNALPYGKAEITKAVIYKPLTFFTIIQEPVLSDPTRNIIPHCLSAGSLTQYFSIFLIEGPPGSFFCQFYFLSL